jgi:phage baseplate assembly protein W
MSGETLTGFAFPFRIERNGGVVQSVGRHKIEEDVVHLLSVRLGERTMLRDYGGGAYHRREEPNSPALAALVRHEIEVALRTFIPELRLVGPLTVVARESQLTVQIQYTAAPDDVLRRLDVTLP